MWILYGAAVVEWLFQLIFHTIDFCNQYKISILYSGKVMLDDWLNLKYVLFNKENRRLLLCSIRSRNTSLVTMTNCDRSKNKFINVNKCMSSRNCLSLEPLIIPHEKIKKLSWFYHWFFLIWKLSTSRLSWLQFSKIFFDYCEWRKTEEAACANTPLTSLISHDVAKIAHALEVIHLRILHVLHIDCISDKHRWQCDYLCE